MSRFGFTGAPRTRGLPAARVGGGFLARFFSSSRASSRGRRDKRYSRTLAIDPLESRCLLSVTPADLTALIVNQTFGSAPLTNPAHSIAADNAGDFVVAWTRQDTTQSDIWARYFTNTVQRVTLPAGTSQFSLTYNDQTIDQISITSGTAPAGSSGASSSTIPETEGTFDLWFNATGKDTMGQNVAAVLPAIQYTAVSPRLPITFSNSAASPSASQKLTFRASSSALTGSFELQVGSASTYPISYDSTSLTTLATTAANIQQALQDAGFAAATVALDPSSTTTVPVFDVTYTGTQSDLLTVNYSSFSGATAATQIQTWLNGFAPVTGISDGTHAIVNSIDGSTLYVDFGPATQGLDQSALLQYVASPPTTATQNLSFNSQSTLVGTDNTSGTTTKTTWATTYSPIQGTIALQVGLVQTAPFTFDSTAPTATATAMQTALQNAGFTGATVSGSKITVTTTDSSTNPPTTVTTTTGVQFAVTFATAEPPIQYVPETFVPNPDQGGGSNQGGTSSSTPSESGPLLAAFSNDADTSAWTLGYLPSVQVSTLDKPFTVNFIPAAPTDGTLTAQGISNYFQPAVTGTQAAPPFDFPPPSIASNVNAPYPYTEPVSVQTGFQPVPPNPTPFVTAAPVVNANGTISTTQFDITFTGISGTTVDAPVVVTNAVDSDGSSLGSTIIGSEGVPTGSTGSSVSMVKQSGNEFQVNPPQTTSVFTPTSVALNSSQPNVAMDGAGNFVIAWEEQVSQQLAPRNVTDIYFRRYAPIGISSISVPGQQYSDVVGSLLSEPNFTGVRALAGATQRLTLSFNPTSTGPFSGVYELQVGSLVTAPISFSSADLPGSAANIQAALASAGYVGATVSVVAQTAATVYSFDMTYNGTSANSALPPIQYVGAFPTTVTFTNSVSAPAASQKLTFKAFSLPVSQLFALQVGNTTTAPITYDSTNQVKTAAAMQTALLNAGYSVTVTADPASTATLMIFDVLFAVAQAPLAPAFSLHTVISPTVYSQPLTTAASVSPPSVAASDPYTQQANISYTNPQYDPAVAMGSNGQFIVVWANQGQDLSYFNNISMQRYDANGNALAYVASVNTGSLTNVDESPSVAIGNDGDAVVTWDETSGANLLNGITAGAQVYARGFSPQSVALWNPVAVGGGAGSSVVMDSQDNFLVSWGVSSSATDPNGFSVSEVLGQEYQLETFNTNGVGTPLAAPTVLRPTFRYNSASTSTTAKTTWPLGVANVAGAIDADGDIAATYEGTGPAVSQNISVPSAYFEQYFSIEQQQLTFTFPGGITSDGSFALQVGTVLTAPITFYANNPSSTAFAIESALVSAGFSTATATGSFSGVNSYTFTISLGASPNEPTITYVGALGGVTFANSVAAPASLQDITFTPTSPATTLSSGLFALKVGTTTTATIYFDGTSASKTAASMQKALVGAGFAGATVFVDVASTSDSFVFDVTFAATEPVIQYTTSTVLPSTMTFGSAITQAWNNADLLPYFDPLDGDTLGNGSVFQTGTSYYSTLYATIYSYNDAATGNSSNASLNANENVDSAINQVLFAAQYTPTVAFGSSLQSIGVPTASQEQLGRLRGILENAAGLLRGEAYGVLMSQWDANPQDSQDATYSDNVVSTQRSGQDQRYYIVVPADVQSGTFTLKTTFAGENTSYNTAAITLTPQGMNTQPGNPINPDATANNISAAINAVLGTVWPGAGAPMSGSVAVRQVSQAEITARSGTIYALPDAVSTDEIPTVTLQVPRGAAAGTTIARSSDTYQAYVFELVFQGQAHDEPITLSLVTGPNAGGTQQWATTTPPATTGTAATPTFAEAGASPVAVVVGDYEGDPGAQAFDASLSMNSSGDMNVAYTYEPEDASAVNLYVEQLAESTNTAGPRIVNMTDGNGVNLINPPGGTATSVNGSYFALTFDQPMLSTDPAINADSVYNVNNYQVLDSAGNQIAGVVAQVHYGLSEVATMAQTYGANFSTNPNALIPDNKWEAVLTLSDNGAALPAGTYTLRVLNAVPPTSTSAGQSGLRNVFGTPLNLTGYNQNGLNFTQQFTFTTSSSSGQTPTAPGLSQTDTPINSVRGGAQIDPAIATSLSGNYVAVWTSTANGQPAIVGQLYNASGLQLGAQFTVNNTTSASWGTPDVAMDNVGNFVVVWSGAGPNSNAQTSPSDVFARIYNYSGQPIGNQFQVDQYVQGVQPPGMQNQPRVAMGPNGTIVVTWTSTPVSVSNTNTANSAVFAREFNKQGAPLSSEFQVTASSTVARSHSDIAIDSNNDFVITWEGDIQNSATWGLYGKYFTASAPSAAITSATESGNTVTITTAAATGVTAGTTIVISGVALTGYNGTYTVASASGTTITYHTVTTGLAASGGGTVSLPISWTATGEMLLNQTPNSRGAFSISGQTSVTDLLNIGPRVAMYPTTPGNRAGFVVTWANFVTSSNTFQVFAQIFNAGGSARSGSFIVNETPAQLQPFVSHPTIGWQLMPAVSIDTLGHITVVWTSFGQDNAEQGNPSILDYGVYARMYNADGSDFFDPGLGTTPLEFRVNATTLGNQVAPVVASDDPSDNSIIAWVGPDTQTAGTTAIYSRIIDPPAVPLSKLALAAPTLTVADTTISAGTAATKATFTVTLSAASTKTVTVNYATSNGTATASSSYTGASGMLTFAPGQTTATVQVNVAGLAYGGLPNTTFLLNLSNPSNATLAKASAAATIIDASLGTAPTPAMSVADVSNSLGSAAASAVFTVTLSNVSAKTVTAYYSTADGTAKAGTDYTAVSGGIYFLPGQTTATITVPLTAMTAAGQANKTFQLNLTSPANATLSRGTATGTIVDSLTGTVAAAPSMSVADVSTSVGSTAGNAVFTVTLSAASKNLVTAYYGTANGTATAGTNYTATSGGIYFLPGQTTTTITVPLAAMTAAGQANKTFQLNLTSPANATLSRGTATGTIVDSLTGTVAAASSMSIADVSTSIGSTAGNAVFTVTLSAASKNLVTAYYGTANGTAAAGTDYTTASGGIYFLPGQTTTTITVPLAAMTAAGQAIKTFQLNLTSPANATLSRGTATGTIVDSLTGTVAAAPSISVADVSTSVGSTAGSAVFTVTLSAASKNLVTAYYGTANGTAAAGTDYTTASGGIYFLPGQTTTTITVPLAAMTAAGQANKAFQLNLTSPANAALSRGTATGTIIDSLTNTVATAAPSISVADVSTSVGLTANKAIFTVTLSAASKNLVTAYYSTANGTAAAGTNYTAVSGGIYFLPGQTTTTISVPLTPITSAGQSSKTFQLNLRTPANATLARASATGTIVDALQASAAAIRASSALLATANSASLSNKSSLSAAAVDAVMTQLG